MKEIIVCSACKGEDCTVDELRETVKIGMKEYAKRLHFPQDEMNKLFNKHPRTARRFLITCQDCGHQLEFMERIEPLDTYSLPKVFVPLDDGNTFLFGDDK